jgi:hypothetical protein
MKYLMLLLTFVFMGCSTTVPVKAKFPDPTPELMKKCENLKKAEGEKVLITDLLKVVVHNYSMYYECSAKVDGWQDWYTAQKRIYESAK